MSVPLVRSIMQLPITYFNMRNPVKAAMDFLVTGGGLLGPPDELHGLPEERTRGQSDRTCNTAIHVDGSKSQRVSRSLAEVSRLTSTGAPFRPEIHGLSAMPNPLYDALESHHNHSGPMYGIAAELATPAACARFRTGRLVFEEPRKWAISKRADPALPP